MKYNFVMIDGYEYELTPERVQRIKAGIAEAKRMIDKEMKYLPEFRNEKEISSLQAHITKLTAALKWR